MTTETDRSPDEVIQFQDGRAELYIGLAIVNGSIPADRLEFTDRMGVEEHVLIFPHDEERKVVPIRQTISFSTSSPAIDASSRGGEVLDTNPLTEDDTRRLLRIYDRFQRRSYPQ